MKKLFFLASLLLLSQRVLAANPVEEVQCEAGGEFGQVITLKLSKEYEYEQLTIKRQGATADYTRTLAGFKGGNYRLDLAARGGISGYEITFKPKTESVSQAASGSLPCDSATTPQPTPSEPDALE